MTPPMQPTVNLDMASLEEELGENVVAVSRIENKHSREISRAARTLNTETLTAERIEGSGNEPVQRLVNDSKDQERSNAARVEFVKGQSIVNATARAKRRPQLPDEQWTDFNRRIIATAANEGKRIERTFRAGAPQRFQAALESATQAHTAAWHRSQEQAGDAIVKTSLVEGEYDRARAGVQEQLGSLISTAAAAHML
ncbi:MAG TPA: hypothetical protein VJL88_14915 [Nitrospira sp.]|nr:hypothetical protein [Nitrospira sp.]